MHQGIAYDTETELIQPGLIAPPLVCASWAMDQNGALLDAASALPNFIRLLESDRILAGANIAFDMLVMACHAATLGQDILPLIFAKYERQEVFDVLIAEQLHALAEGCLGKDPKTFSPLRSPSTGKPAGYSLEVVTYIVCHRTDAKANDRWRLNYAELKNIPISEWPEDARTYPVDDAINTLEVAVLQSNRNRNLHDLAFQCYTALCLQLGAVWGFNVNPEAIALLRETTQAKKLQGQQEFLDVGLLKTVKEKGEFVVKKHTVNFKTAIANAYQCVGTCPACDGLGKVPGATPCPKTKHVDIGCTICLGFGFKPKTCKTCDGTTYNLDESPVPRTDGGGVAGGRDPLYESGDETLINFAAWGEADKILTTYIPWLEKGLKDGVPIPLNPRPSVLKETGRLGASTEHQIPREGGVRECIWARPGWLIVSCDWTGAELNTHAQNCLEMVGWSRMAEALNAGIKVHDQLAAQIIGCDYDHMVANRKTIKELGDARQAAKPPNFGFPGRMGAVTLVLQQRKQGPDTTGPDGRKYKGLRLCILAGGQTTCGTHKVMQWGRREIPPTCKHCIETAEDIRKVWIQTWPENNEYFEICDLIHQSGESIEPFSKRVRGGATLCATANGPFQGRAGHMMKLALQRICFEAYVDKTSVLYNNCRPIVPIHDEFLGEVREAMASECAKRISEIMVQVMCEVCPDMVRAAEAEPAIMRVWSKDAEPVWGPDGELLLWVPKAKE